MTGNKRQRRHRAARYAVLVLGLAVIGVTYAAITGTGGPASATTAAGPSALDIAKGQAIFAETCSSCHGLNAEGTSAGPPLVGVGAAAVDFQMSTGRMPGKDLDAEMPRKPVRSPPSRSTRSRTTSPLWAGARRSPRPLR